MPKLTANFNSEEFACKCGCGADLMNPALVEGLQQLREQLQHSVMVTSGRRCPAHNLKVGGADSSLHLWGRAADITVPGVPIRTVYREARKIAVFKGFGLDEQRGMLHVDVRSQNHVTHWVYLGGKAVPGWPTGLDDVSVGAPA